LLANKNKKVAQGNLHFPKGLSLGNISSLKIPFMNKKDSRICFSGSYFNTIFSSDNFYGAQKKDFFDVITMAGF
jgi:hypothetical protein